MTRGRLFFCSSASDGSPDDRMIVANDDEYEHVVLTLNNNNIMTMQQWIVRSGRNSSGRSTPGRAPNVDRNWARCPNTVRPVVWCIADVQ